jgi:hypothetical protein
MSDRASFLRLLEGAYEFEGGLCEALAHVIPEVDNKGLRGALEVHLGETPSRLRDLTVIFDFLGKSPRGLLVSSKMEEALTAIEQLASSGERGPARDQRISLAVQGALNNNETILELLRSAIGSMADDLERAMQYRRAFSRRFNKIAFELIDAKYAAQETGAEG